MERGKASFGMVLSVRPLAGTSVSSIPPVAPITVILASGERIFICSAIEMRVFIWPAVPAPASTTESLFFMHAVLP